MSSALANGLAGAGGGLIAQILTYPLQTVNTRQQIERVAKKGIDGSHGAATRLSESTLDQILQVVKAEGWGGLYSGLKPSLLGTVASQGVYYYFYQVFKDMAQTIAATRKAKGVGDGNVGTISWLAVAAAAGSLNVLITSPIWILVTRMQTHTQAERNVTERKKNALLKKASENNWVDSTLHDKLSELESTKPKPYGMLHAASEIHNEAGVPGFWKGTIPALIMVSNPSIQFMIYEISMKSLREKRAATKRGVVKQVTALEVFLLGAVAKLGATFLTYPLLVVKSRLRAKQDIDKNTSIRYSGTIDAIMKMIQYEGFPGFYKGISTKIVQSVFAASVLFMMKEELVKAFMLLTNKNRRIRTNALR